MSQNQVLHDLNQHQMVQTFYNGIIAYTRQLADLQGLITNKTPIAGKEIIENLAEHSRE